MGTFSFGVLLGAAAGGAIAGAIIGGVSYLVSNSISGNENTAKGFWGAVGVGALNGAIGGVAGTVGGLAKVALSVGAGVIAGVYTASNAEGTKGQKIAMGIATGLITAGSTFLGASIDTSDLSSGLTAFANYSTTMAIAAPAEILVVTSQTIISNCETSTPRRSVPRNYVAYCP